MRNTPERSCSKTVIGSLRRKHHHGLASYMPTFQGLKNSRGVLMRNITDLKKQVIILYCIIYLPMSLRTPPRKANFHGERHDITFPLSVICIIVSIMEILALYCTSGRWKKKIEIILSIETFVMVWFVLWQGLILNRQIYFLLGTNLTVEICSLL